MRKIELLVHVESDLYDFLYGDVKNDKEAKEKVKRLLKEYFTVKYKGKTAIISKSDLSENKNKTKKRLILYFSENDLLYRFIMINRWPSEKPGETLKRLLNEYRAIIYFKRHRRSISRGIKKYLEMKKRQKY